MLFPHLLQKVEQTALRVSTWSKHRQNIFIEQKGQKVGVYFHEMFAFQIWSWVIPCADFIRIALTWLYSVPILTWKIPAGWAKTLETGCVSAGGSEGSHLCALWGVPAVSRITQSFRWVSVSVVTASVGALILQSHQESHANPAAQGAF